MTPQYIQWTIPSLFYRTGRKNPFGHNERVNLSECIDKYGDEAERSFRVLPYSKFSFWQVYLRIKILIISYLSLSNYAPPITNIKRWWGTFGADHIAIILVCTLILWTSGQILTTKDFNDLGLIFKITTALNIGQKNAYLAPSKLYILKHLGHSKELIRFGDLDLFLR